MELPQPTVTYPNHRPCFFWATTDFSPALVIYKNILFEELLLIIGRWLDRIVRFLPNAVDHAFRTMTDFYGSIPGAMPNFPGDIARRMAYRSSRLFKLGTRRQ
ncbi:MAG: hypothetical protein M0Q44_15640 [Methylobacter sp.]|jgi:hypothetical protein|nr:hypothetical protein [Methylobacter sp.]